MFDSCSKGVHAWLLPAKGVDFDTADIAIAHIARSLTELGYKRVAIRSDGEHALLALLRSVTKYWGGEVVPEQSPTGDLSQME